VLGTCGEHGHHGCAHRGILEQHELAVTAWVGGARPFPYERMENTDGEAGALALSLTVTETLTLVSQPIVLMASMTEMMATAAEVLSSVPPSFRSKRGNLVQTLGMSWMTTTILNSLLRQRWRYAS